jgi:hypothetical protein
MRFRSRLFAAGFLGAALVFLAAGSAHARDGGADAGAKEDAAPVDDGGTGAHTICIAIGNPCTPTDTCCEADAGAYCGEFGGQENYACGLSSGSNRLATGCSVAAIGATGLTGGIGLGLLGLAIGAGLCRRRPRHGSSPAA